MEQMKWAVLELCAPRDSFKEQHPEDVNWNLVDSYKIPAYFGRGRTYTHANLSAIKKIKFGIDSKIEPNTIVTLV